MQNSLIEAESEGYSNW